MIYLLNFNMTYIIIFATCFDSYESSSGINFKNYCTYCFTVIMSYSFLSNYCNRDPFLHYKTRVNVSFCNAKRDPYCNSSTKNCKT